MTTPGLETILSNLAPSLRGLIFSLPESVIQSLEEIRVRKLRPLAICFKGTSSFITPRGELCQNPAGAYLVSPEEILLTLQIVSRSSVYVFEEQLKQGFITLPGGHRVGVCGHFLIENGRIIGIKEVSGLNLRIAREVIGCAVPLLPKLLDESGQLVSTLIVSPPQGGKTTLLRDLTRLISTGSPSLNLPGCKVVVVDERSEIAGVYDGIPQLDVGPSTDVLDACPKPEGIRVAVRSLSPDVVVTDEIGTAEDVDALLEAVNSGVRIIASVHAGSWRELEARPSLQPLFQEKTFVNAVLLSRRHGPGTIEGVMRFNRQLPGRIEVANGA